MCSLALIEYWLIDSYSYSISLWNGSELIESETRGGDFINKFRSCFHLCVCIHAEMPIVHAPKNNKQRKRFEASFRTWIFQKSNNDFDTRFVKTRKETGWFLTRNSRKCKALLPIWSSMIQSDQKFAVFKFNFNPFIVYHIQVTYSYWTQIFSGNVF